MAEKEPQLFLIPASPVRLLVYMAPDKMSHLRPNEAELVWAVQWACVAPLLAP